MLMHSPRFPKPRSGRQRFWHYAALILCGLLAFFTVFYVALTAATAAVDGDTICAASKKTLGRDEDG